jgi:hypothetical protein
MTLTAALFLLILCAMPADAVVTPLEQPAGIGSQLIFYYDTRPGFTTYVNVRNIGPFPVQVKLDFWDSIIETKVSQTLDLLSEGGRVINAGELTVTAGLAAQQGVAFASIVDGEGNPIHVRRALMGNFTVANLATESSWGAPAAARSARAAADDSEPVDGTVVDGTTIAYQTIQPTLLTLGTYYNPETLAPVQDHGNQMISINFEDPATVGADVAFGVNVWTVHAFKGNDGQLVTDLIFTLGGVDERDIVSFLGPTANGSSGGAIFTSNDSQERNSRMIYFVQSLGTFGSGYLLPSD